jgi:hypothetical protein
VATEIEGMAQNRRRFTLEGEDAPRRAGRRRTAVLCSIRRKQGGTPRLRPQPHVAGSNHPASTANVLAAGPQAGENSRTGGRL